MNIDVWKGDGARWDELVARASDGTVMHLFGWKAVCENAYGHRTFYLAAADGDDIRAVLPLVLVKGPLVEPHLVSVPYMDYGGVCGNGDEEAERALAERAVAIAEAHRAKLVLRYLREPGLDLPVSHEKVTMFLDLGTSESALWERLPSTRRNRIRKGQKSGLSVRFPGADEVERFYTVFATNMRDLGSPVHGIPFFREILEQLPANARLVLLEQGSVAVGAALMLVFKGVISLPWISSLRPYFHLCPNQVLYWESMKWGIGEGHDILDFGRSSRDSGTFEAKRQWGAEPVPLFWHYWPGNAVPPGEDVKRLSWGVHLWQRLPLPVANRVGPWLRAGIPN